MTPDMTPEKNNEALVPITQEPKDTTELNISEFDKGSFIVDGVNSQKDIIALSEQSPVDLDISLGNNSGYISLESLQSLESLTISNFDDLRRINKMPASLNTIHVYGFESDEEAYNFTQEINATRPDLKKQGINIENRRSNRYEQKMLAENGKNETIKDEDRAESFLEQLKNTTSGILKSLGELPEKAKKMAVSAICPEYSEWKKTNNSDKDDFLSYLEYKTLNQF